MSATAEEQSEGPIESLRASQTKLLAKAFANPLADFYVLMTSIGLLVVLGIIMVLSSSSAYALATTHDAYYFFIRQLIFLSIGLFAAWWLTRRSNQFFMLFGWLVLCGAILLQVYVLTPLNRVPSGISNKGNNNWAYFPGGFSVQPAEFAKLGLILWAASVLANRGRAINEPKKLFFPFLLGFGVVLGLDLAGGDFGTALMIAAIMMALLWFVGAPIRALLLLVLSGLAASAAMVLARPSRRVRVEAFLTGTGVTSDQPLHALYALASGGWWGVGLGRSRMKWGGLYDGVLNDYVFAVLGEELGLVGTIALIILFFVLGAAGLRTAVRNTETFWRLSAAGITAWFMVQASANIAVAMKLFPVMGVPLPFISYGGSALLANLMAVGVLLAAARHEPAALMMLKARVKTHRKSRKSVTISGKD